MKNLYQRTIEVMGFLSLLLGLLLFVSHFLGIPLLGINTISSTTPILSLVCLVFSGLLLDMSIKSKLRTQLQQ